ncbi:hypothetical protein Leryth_020054 [Lithospermum erythrorhizon]|uniref:Phytocyanin domain-containing protein n=1 Tax=Lithospermum erythrorhizon TaxID=34254 RepID=A0AAV3QVD1_LITER|nr:hypothetical protein Leryth_020054 [Lithospermum erythrorhizon]
MATLGVETRGFGIIFLVVVLVSMQSSSGEIHKVGDSAGWTTIGNVDYKQWAATKTFKIGDVIVFQYKPEYHNVMQVTHAEFRACNVSSSISTHTTGNDSITITTPGHHFFLCSVPGHCQAGQKVDINVLNSASTAPPQSATPAAVAAAQAPAPAPSVAAPLHGLNRLSTVCLLIALALVSGFC